MGRQGEGGGLKILKNEETSFMDEPQVSRHFKKISFLKNDIHITLHQDSNDLSAFYFKGFHASLSSTQEFLKCFYL